VWIRVRQLADQADLDTQGDEVLLRSVVKIALDPAARRNPGSSRRRAAAGRRQASVRRASVGFVF
jgi:hypothetical protein